VLRQLIEHIGAVFWLTDVGKRRMIYVSPAYERIWRRSCESLYRSPRNWLDPVHPDDRERLEQALHKQASGEYDQIYRIVRPDGDVRWIHDRAYPIRDEHGSVYRVAGAAQDITEQKRVEAELENQRERLEELVRERTTELAEARRRAEAASEAKSVFLATMSHEIRTPVNGMLGMIELLERSSLDDYQRELIATARASAVALIGVVDGILDFSKIEAGRMNVDRAPVELIDLVEGVSSSLLSVARSKNVYLHLFIAPEVPRRVASDDVRLRQVLYNVIGNAIKFSAGISDRPARVSVQVESIPHLPHGVRFTVVDNGIGMTPDAMKRLFRPFEQAEASTTRRFGGTGLGLAICDRLVKLMGGHIGIESEPGVGTRVAITVPLEPLEMDAAEASAALAGITCIVATSTQWDAGELASTLAHGGANVTLCDDVERALRATNLNSSFVVLCDAQQAARFDTALRRDQSRSRAPCVVITTRSDSAGKSQGAIIVDPQALRRATLYQAVLAACGRIERIEQPVADTSELVAVKPPSIAEARQRRELILVVEDDQINQQVLLRQLATLGYAAEVASNGAVALKMWRESDYGLVLTDLNMPEMDGYDLARRIRELEGARLRTPVVALTANALRSDSLKAYSAGVDDQVTKPCSLHQLRSVLLRWMPISRGAEPSQDAPPASVFDVHVLTRLVGGDLQGAEQLLRIYVNSLAEVRDTLDRGHDRRRVAEIAAIAHRFKSASTAVGALRMRDVCAELESACHSDDMHRIAACMGELRRALEEAREAIQAFLETPRR